MNVSVIGFTYSPLFPVAAGSWYSAMEGMKTLSGAAAGTCYMKDEFFGTYVSDPVKALKRFVTVANTGHHSIAGHAQVTVLLEGIPKIVAMYLNNLRDYETSEKSARYTVMQDVSDMEKALYTRWVHILKDCITESYKGHPKFDEIPVEKLAMENARYMLSVFTPTTMVYTTSLRQWNYILDWACNFSLCTMNDFAVRVNGCLHELATLLKPLLYVKELRDTKGRGFDMISRISEDVETGTKVNTLSEIYEARSAVSFAALAQMQRHRTLRYSAKMPDSVQNYSYFVPEILRGTVFEKDWLKDIASVAHLYPQGLLLQVHESGAISDFRLKAMERLCGRAQWEIMRDTQRKAELLGKRAAKGLLTAEAKEIVESLCEGGCSTKCKLLSCKEPCAFGAKDALTRVI